MTSIYNAGTVTVTNGSAAVVGAGTAWAVSLVTGGLFTRLGVAIPILSVTDDTNLTLAYPWPGATAAAAAYAIDRENSSASNIVDLYDKLTRVLLQLSLAGITPNNSGTLAKRNALTLGAGDDNYLYLHAEIGVAFAFYRWDGPSLAWVGPFSVANAVATGGVSSLVAGTGITVDNTNPAIPVVGLANMANATIKGRTSAGAGAPQDLTMQQAANALNSYLSAGIRNRLINGDGAINQRGVTAPTDDTYGWDRHNVLTQTAAIGISTLSNVANGLPSMMRLTQSQATAQRMGNSHIVERVNCVDLRGKTITLVGKLRNSIAAATRYAILEWTGAADAVVSDIVNSWTNGTFTAGQFFNATTLNVLAVGAITPVAATVTDILLTATVGAAANNLIVFLWTETAQAQNSTLDIAWELLDYDATGKTYPTEFRPRAIELMLCKRYYFQVGGNTAFEVFGVGFDSSATLAYITFPHQVTMRVTPTFSISSPAHFQINDGNISVVTGMSVPAGTPDTTTLAVTVASGLTVGRAGLVQAANTLSARARFEAEL
ncbi:MAG: hypothetical protein E5Y74_01715 [Mesorhizobium sp.]|nr:MAG: hypothetical protein E5Y74_01715 [Mesorhizobium sp.]